MQKARSHDTSEDIRSTAERGGPFRLPDRIPLPRSRTERIEQARPETERKEDGPGRSWRDAEEPIGNQDQRDQLSRLEYPVQHLAVEYVGP